MHGSWYLFAATKYRTQLNLTQKIIQNMHYTKTNASEVEK
jgi:hypothetical protein